MINKNYSGLKICWHPDKLKALYNNEVTPPLYVRIKPTNVCNHKCFYCSYQKENGLVLSECFKPHDSIPYEIMMQLLEDMKYMGVKAVTYSGGGEPLVYKHIEDVLQRTIEYGIDFSIITNGQYLKDQKAELLSKAKWVRVSLETTKSKTFEQIRGVPCKNLEEILRNIEKFAANKSNSCELGINYVVNHFNYNEIYIAASDFKKLGVNHIKFTALIEKGSVDYHQSFKQKACELIHQAEDELSDDSFSVLNKYESDFNYATANKRMYKKCPISQIVTVIGADTGIYLCHDKTYTKNGRLGLLKEKTFADIWKSSETKDKFLSFDASVSCKHHCTYDERNIFIRDVLASAGAHENFI